MATLMDAHLPSDDEEDEDFDPTKAPTGGGKGSKGGKGAKRGFMEVSDDDDDDDDCGDDAAAAGVCGDIADGLADAMDDARYCAAAEPEEPAARRPIIRRRDCACRHRTDSAKALASDARDVRTLLDC